MITKTLIRTVRQGGVPDAGGSLDISADADSDLDVVVPQGSTNLHVTAFAAVIAKLKLFMLICDRALTVKTNSSGAPANTFELAAGVPFIWAAGDPAMHDTDGIAVTVDIASLYVTNAAGVDANFQLRSLSDAS